MTTGEFRRNEFGQPIGFELPGWKAPPFPPHAVHEGRFCRLEPLRAGHARDIFEAQRADTTGERWTYLFQGPYPDFESFEKWCAEAQGSRDPQYYAIVEGGRAAGFAAWMRIEPRHGVMEVGSIYLAPRLSKTRAASEAIYLFIAGAFELGYRRFEWKCDSCNLPSRAAAVRFGFSYEGLFRQAIVNKGRNRDTTWFAIVDRDWHGGLHDAWRRWLDAANFDAAGRQKLRLSELTAPFVAADSSQVPPTR